MKLIRKFIRPIAAFLFINMVNQICFPLVSMALTSGPTAPEATSFEPIDTTDMVNLLTGDLAYNTPLLEVPGPSGGYPLSLSYHAGIMPGEEASWVGLGWTLNPGAINRNVNGFADDHKDVSQVTRSYWKGGERHTAEIGITLGVAGLVGVTTGMSVGHDTYQGMGFGYSVKLNKNFGISNVSLGAELDPWGNVTKGGTYNFKVQGSGSVAKLATYKIGLSTNFNTVSLNSRVSFGTGLTQYSISTNQGKGSFTFRGASANISNNKLGKISTRSVDITLPLPLIHLGYKYLRYWSDETDAALTNGALYFPDFETDIDWSDDHAYDTYSILDPTADGGIIDNPNPEKLMGGSFADYDDYRVSAQGISGSIKPYFFQKHLLRRNRQHVDEENESIYDIVHHYTGYDTKNLGFRFVNEFSNRYEYDPNDFEMDAYWDPDEGETGTGHISLDYTWQGDPITGKNEYDGIYEDRLVGVKHIEHFTNEEINDHMANLENGDAPDTRMNVFLETQSTGFNREGLPEHQIGAFTITNESGVTYTFALPVYADSEYQYSEKIDKSDGLSFNEFKNPEKYAYTWHLTSIVGPDYVDRGILGQLDDEDWGYWVKFDYGRWTDQYRWRSPEIGFRDDLDAGFQNYSTGRKELYYLDAIETKTNIALFVKDVRYDAHGISVPNPNSLNDNFDYHFDDSDVVFNEETIECSLTYGYEHYTKTGNNSQVKLNPTYSGAPTHRVPIEVEKTFEGEVIPVPSLKLNKILLLDKRDLTDHLGGSWSDLKSVDSSLDEDIDFSIRSCVKQTEREDDLGLCDYEGALDPQEIAKMDMKTALGLSSGFTRGTNVLDIHDYPENELEEISLRVVDFETDYSLVPGTINSFDENGDPQGKLTLKALAFKGKGGASLIPATRFGYDLEDDGFITTFKMLDDHSGFFNTASHFFDDGNLLKVTTVDGLYEGTFLFTRDGGIIDCKTLEGNFPVDDLYRDVVVKHTKNPPYNSDCYDIWGMYKPDYDEDNLKYSRNISRLTSSTSAQSADVWSMRQITSPMGSNINISYDSDSYQEVVENTVGLLLENATVTDITKSEVHLSFFNDFSLKFIENELLNQTLPVSILLRYGAQGPGQWYCDGVGQTGAYTWKEVEVDAKIIEVQSDYVIVQNQVLAEQLEKIYGRCGYNSETGEIRSDPDGWGWEFDTKGLLVSGFIEFDDPKNVYSSYGGGIAVSKLNVENGISDYSSTTDYSYDKGCTLSEPYGLEVPLKNVLDKGVNSCILELEEKFLNEYRKLYLDRIYGDYLKILAAGRFMPAPGVMYGEVKVQNSTTKSGSEVLAPNYTVYEFDVGNESVEIERSEPAKMGNEWMTNTDHPVWVDSVKNRSVVVADWSSRVGNLRATRQYDANDQKMSETIRHYLHDEPYSSYEELVEERYGGQGVVKESFVDARYVIQDYDGEYKYLYPLGDGDFVVEIAETTAYHLLGVVSEIVQYPNIETGSTTINYRTSSGTYTENLAYDYYSGQVTEVYTEDASGQKYVTKTVPAYMLEEYPPSGPRPEIPTRHYPKMGLKGMDPENLNMLTQEGASYTYKLPDDFDLETTDWSTATDKGLVGASIQTWSDEIPVLFEGTQPGIFRKLSGYHWIGDGTDLNADGTFPTDNFEEYIFPNDGSNEITDIGWQKSGEISLVDVYSHALEATDINGNYAATKMDVNQERVLATGANVTYYGFTHSSFENAGDGGLSDPAGASILQVDHAHSGEHIFSSGSAAKAVYAIEDVPFELQGKKNFVLIYWLANASPDDVTPYIAIDGGGDQGLQEMYGDTKHVEISGVTWYMQKAMVTVPAGVSNMEIGVKATTPYELDDFRFQPVDAAVTAYAYNEWGELSHILDNNNLFTQYEYDAMGRLKSVSKETFAHGVKMVSSQEIRYANQDQSAQ